MKPSPASTVKALRRIARLAMANAEKVKRANARDLKRCVKMAERITGPKRRPDPDAAEHRAIFARGFRPAPLPRKREEPSDFTKSTWRARDQFRFRGQIAQGVRIRSKPKHEPGSARDKRTQKRREVRVAKKRNDGKRAETHPPRRVAK